MKKRSVDVADSPTLEELNAMRFDTPEALVQWVTANYAIEAKDLIITPRQAVGLRYVPGDIALSRYNVTYGIASDNDGGEPLDSRTGGKWAFDELGLASLVKGTAEAGKLDPFDIERVRTLQRVKAVMRAA